jgi:hypothetical protein
VSLVHDIRAACANPAAVDGARQAFAMVQDWSAAPVYRLPGCGTLERLALRIHRGATIEQAAAKEYAHRWHLPLNQWVNFAQTDRARCRHSGRQHCGAWPVPHAIGM